jgi:hypothetical protein
MMTTTLAFFWAKAGPPATIAAAIGIVVAFISGLDHSP